MDEEDFLQELEADREMRARVNIYKSDVTLKKEGGDDEQDEDDGEDGNDEDEDDQKITLDELLDNLVLDSKPDAVVEDAAVGGDADAEQFRGFIEEGLRAAKDKIGYVGRDEALGIQAKETAIPVVGNVWGEDFMHKDGK